MQYFCSHVNNVKHSIEPGPSHFRMYLTTALGNISNFILFNSSFLWNGFSFGNVRLALLASQRNVWEYFKAIIISDLIKKEGASKCMEIQF